jgi:hypothetical protein
MPWQPQYCRQTSFTGYLNHSLIDIDLIVS